MYFPSINVLSIPYLPCSHNSYLLYRDIDMAKFVTNFFFGTEALQYGKAQSLSISISLWNESDLNLTLKLLLLIRICNTSDKVLWWIGIIKNYVQQDSFFKNYIQRKKWNGLSFLKICSTVKHGYSFKIRWSNSN